MANKRTATTPAAYSLRAVLQRAIAYWRPYWPQASLIVLALLVFELFSTFFALSFKLIIDGIQAPTTSLPLIVVIGGLLAGFVLAAGASIVAEQLTARTGACILNDLRFRMFEHLQSLAMEYYARTRMGDILARFSSDLAAIEQGLTRQFIHGVVATLALIINMLVLFWLEWRLALVTFAAWPLIAVMLGRLTTATSAASYTLKHAEAHMVNTIQEHISSQAVVKAFGFQHFTAMQMQQQLAALATTGTTAFLLKGMVATSSLLSVLFMQLLVAGVGAWLAASGYLSVGALIAFLGLLSMVGRNAYELSKRVLPDIVAASGGVQRLEQLLAEEPSLSDAPQAVTLPRPVQGIHLHDVSFGYNEQDTVLKHITLNIPIGHFVAFVGPSGSGKSTLLSLLMRFYDSTAGTITIDGHDIRHVTQESLRRHMGVVFQESFLLDTTIRENLRLARPEATDAEIEQAAQTAEIHTSIMRMPDGYDTMTGAAGENLSGGQRQRLAIARALVRDPAILLLDEPTSALDAPTQAAISATLERQARQRTVILATHHLASVVNADQIFVLDAGQIVEAGTHETLRTQQGLYHHLWQNQQAAHPNAGEHLASVMRSRVPERAVS
jgi:ATP-binding cassette subfamily B protein